MTRVRRFAHTLSLKYTLKHLLPSLNQYAFMPFGETRVELLQRVIHEWDVCCVTWLHFIEYWMRLEHGGKGVTRSCNTSTWMYTHTSEVEQTLRKYIHRYERGIRAIRQAKEQLWLESLRAPL